MRNDNTDSLKYTFDEHSKILYFYLDEPENCTSEDDSSGYLLLRTSIKTNKPNGVTVLDFDMCPNNVLCMGVSGFLDVSSTRVALIAETCRVKLMLKAQNERDTQYY